MDVFRDNGRGVTIRAKFGPSWGDPALTNRDFDLAVARRAYFEIKDADFWDACERCYPYTLLSVERMYDLYEAVRYVCRADVPGDLVECGALLGGAAMLVAEALSAAGDAGRRIYLFDTFAGFTGRTPNDVDFAGNRFGDWRAERFRSDTEENLRLVNFPFERFVLVEGDVLETLPSAAPDRVAVLRLDTDTYSTTLHELTTLYPRLSPGGALLVDDYGFCEGCRRATDEYFAAHTPIRLHRVDYTGRSGIKSG